MNNEQTDEGQTPTPELVRTRRLEIVDPTGRVRAALGPMVRPFDEGQVEGLSFFDEYGSSLMDLVLTDDGGVRMSFAIDGNSRIDLGAFPVPPGSALPGAVLSINDAGGTPVLRWRVSPDGEVSSEQPPPD